MDVHAAKPRDPGAEDIVGKDHYEQTTDKFDIKPIDPETGEAIPRLDHWVEAELSACQAGRPPRRRKL